MIDPIIVYFILGIIWLKIDPYYNIWISDQDMSDTILSLFVTMAHLIVWPLMVFLFIYLTLTFQTWREK